VSHARSARKENWAARQKLKCGRHLEGFDENVNLMAGNLTAQVRNIATVTTAVANGNLTKKITVDVKGEFLELKDTVNVMVDQLRSFASEVTEWRAKLFGRNPRCQARVEGVSGTWKDLTDSVISWRQFDRTSAQYRGRHDRGRRGDLSKRSRSM